jgi:sugar phosphate isomerase/epimerase
MNKPDFYLENDPREKALRDAAHRAIATAHRMRCECVKIHQTFLGHGRRPGRIFSGATSARPGAVPGLS